MTWDEAITAMLQGALVRRRSEVRREVMGSPGGNEVVDVGTEPMRLLAAWTHDDKPVRVFAGAWSRVPFVPDDEHRAATDWEVS